MNKGIKIYTYVFPCGQVFVGRTIRTLDYVHNYHKRCKISPIHDALKKLSHVYPKLESTIPLGTPLNEIYKIQRKIVYRYTTDPAKIINTNIK